MRVGITTAAKADLIAIGDFIKPNNPERAARETAHVSQQMLGTIL
jgi:plasmid stabilization system protein ParE